MIGEEITIKDLIKKFRLNIHLPKRLVDLEISSDFLNANMETIKSNYIFTVDNVILIINPQKRDATIQKIVRVNGKIIGGFVAGYDSKEYIN